MANKPGKEKRRDTKARHAVITFADDTIWIASTKEQLEKIIEIAEEFFNFNDIQINPNKSKLVIMNTKRKPEEKKVIVGKQELFSIKEKEAVRFLGIWIGNKVGKKQIIAKAKQTTRLFANLIKKKLVSVSQVLYINNICLIPKLEYLLQHVYLTKEEYEKIQQPYIIIAKNKVGLARTVPTCIMSHSGILNMRMLWNVMKTKQTLSLINRLNSKSDIRNIMELRIRQGQGLLGYTSNIWTENIGEDEAKLLKNNLACLIIQENLNIGLEIIANREN